MLSRKQMWRKVPKGKNCLFSYEEHHANDYQRNLLNNQNNKNNDSNSFNLKTKLPNDKSDIYTQKLSDMSISPLPSSKSLGAPLKSCMSSSNLLNLSSLEEQISSPDTKKSPSIQSNSKPKKKIKFSLVIKVCLIYERKELMPIASDLFWTPADCDRFKKDAFTEVIRCKQKYNCTAKESIIMLYQPDPVNDHILQEIVDLIETANNNKRLSLLANTETPREGISVVSDSKETTAVAAAVPTKTTTENQEKSVATANSTESETSSSSLIPIPTSSANVPVLPVPLPVTPSISTPSYVSSLSSSTLSSGTKDHISSDTETSTATIDKTSTTAGSFIDKLNSVTHTNGSSHNSVTHTNGSSHTNCHIIGPPFE